jgi:hypothetical protein
MRKFASKDVIGVVVLLVLFVVAVLILTGTGHGGGSMVGPEDTLDPSIYNDRSSGSRGLFEWCLKLGYRPLPWRQDWHDLPPDASVLVCTAPRWSSRRGFIQSSNGSMQYQDGVGALTSSDAIGLRQWLGTGHTLLLMSSQLPVNHLADLSGGEGDDDSYETRTFSDILGLGTQAALSRIPQRDFPPVQPGALTQDVSSIRLSAHAGEVRLIRAKKDFVFLFGDLSGSPARDEPVAVQFSVGKGRVIAIADSYFASNGNLPQASNAAFIASVLRTGATPGATVLFDEFHHGDTYGQGDIWDALGRPLRLGLAQLAIAMIVLAIALGARFGMPTALGRIRPHNSGEYVTSLAGLYHSAGATAPALETIYRQFLRDLCSRLALPPDVSLQQLAEAAARRGKLDRNALRSLLSLCERHLDQKQLTDGELLDLVRQMERFRKQMGIV